MDSWIPLDSPLTSSMRMESTSVPKCCDIEVIHGVSIKVDFGYQDPKNSRVSLTAMGEHEPGEFPRRNGMYRIKARCHCKHVPLYFVEVEVEVEAKTKRTHYGFPRKSWNFLHRQLNDPQKSRVVAVHPQPFAMTSSPTFVVR